MQSGLAFACVRRKATRVCCAPHLRARRCGREVRWPRRVARALAAARTHTRRQAPQDVSNNDKGSCAYGAFRRACRTCAGRCPRAPPRGSAPPPSARAASTPNHPLADPALRNGRRVTHTHTRTRRMSAARRHTTCAAAARTYGAVAQRCASAKHAHTHAQVRERTKSKSGSPSTGSALGRMSSSSSSSSSSYSSSYASSPSATASGSSTHALSSAPVLLAPLASCGAPACASAPAPALPAAAPSRTADAMTWAS